MGIAISRTLRNIATDPILNSQGGRIDTANDTKDSKHDVSNYLALRTGAGPEVKEGLY